MGANSELLAVGKFDRNIVHNLDYPCDHYDTCKKRNKYSYEWGGFGGLSWVTKDGKRTTHWFYCLSEAQDFARKLNRIARRKVNVS